MCSPWNLSIPSPSQPYQISGSGVSVSIPVAGISRPLIILTSQQTSSPTTRRAHSYHPQCRLLTAQPNDAPQNPSETRDDDDETTQRLCARPPESGARSVKALSKPAMEAIQLKKMARMNTSTGTRVFMHTCQLGERDRPAPHTGRRRAMAARNWYDGRIYICMDMD